MEDTIINKNKELIVDQLIANNRQLDELLTIKGKENLFIFNKYILGMEKGNNAVIS